MNETKIRALLGLANRARKLAIGATAVDAGLRKKKVRLILLAGNAGAASERKIRNACEISQQHCPIVTFLSKEAMGEICNRAEVAVLGVLDENFAAGIIGYFNTA